MITASRVPAAAATLRSQNLTSKMAYGSVVASQKLVSRAFASSRSRFSGLTVPESRKTPLNQHINLPVSQIISPYTSLPLTRSFHVATPRWEQQRQEKQGEANKSESEGNNEGKEEGKKEEGENEEGKKEAPPPPPPHGDKTPWQVFRETLQSEFKESKEWNEGRKALASSAHQFSENENIKRARAAYEAASGAATSRTSSAFKTTGQAIGKGAAWTWNTPVVKGVRLGVNATGSGFEKVTRPVRETDAYKSAVGGVKNAIDDGSSSRYGGWIEKEERRRQKQLRDEIEAKSGKRRTVNMTEDPK